MAAVRWQHLAQGVIGCGARWLAGRRAPLLSVALALSCLGDVLLDVRSADLFIPGLCAFLAAHVSYTALFLRRNPRPRRLALLAVVLVYAVSFSAWLVPSLGGLAAPVLLYVCAITAMVVSAALSGLPWPVAAGAILFLISDSLLAVAKFKHPVPLRGGLVWSTYYMAQYLIATWVL